MEREQTTIRLDVTFVQICDECPEQYNAYGPDGNQIGYIRVRWGWCCVWCPDAGSNEEVYAAALKNGWWSFGSNKERKKHLRMAKAAIRKWALENQLCREETKTS